MSRIAILLMLVFFASSCLAGQQQNAGPETMSATEKITEKEAKRLAGDYLQKKELKWGDATAVTVQGDSYWVGYSTPMREKKLLGVRTLIVDRKSGEVKPLMRR